MAPLPYDYTVLRCQVRTELLKQLRCSQEMADTLTDRAEQAQRCSLNAYSVQQLVAYCAAIRLFEMVAA